MKSLLWQTLPLFLHIGNAFSSSKPGESTTTQASDSSTYSKTGTHYTTVVSSSTKIVPGSSSWIPTASTGRSTSSSTSFSTTTTILATTEYSAQPLEASITATTPVLTTTTASNGDVVPYLYVPAAALGAQAAGVVGALGGVAGDGVGIFGGFLDGLGLAGLVESFQIPSLAGVALGAPIVYDASPTRTTTGASHTTSSTSKTEATSSKTTSSSSSSTSTAPTASSTPWVILSKAGTSEGDFESTLKSQLDNYASGTLITFPSFQIFTVSLNSTMAEMLSGLSVIETVEQDGLNEASDIEKASSYDAKRKREESLEANHLERRAQTTTLSSSPTLVMSSFPEATDLVSQVDSPANLKLLSDYTKGKDAPEYTFQSSLGKDVYVYVIDTGINRAHADFERNPVQILATGYAPDDDEGHGTRMADLVGGAWAGVAKKAQIVSAKFGSGQSGEPLSLKGRVASTWSAVIHDVISQGRQGKAVISFSSSWDSYVMYQSHVFRSQEEYDNHLQNTIFNKLIEACFEAGITVVVAAGNQGKHGVDVNSRVPAALAQSSLLPDLITVGSVGSSGTISPFTNADKDGIITVYANGEDIVAADYASNDGWTVASGTSEATAQVAGLVAYFLGRSDLSEQLHQGGNAQVAHNVKQYLISQAERYTNNGPLIANNGELSILQMLTCDLEQPSAAMLAVKRNAGFSLSTEAFTKEYEMICTRPVSTISSGSVSETSKTEISTTSKTSQLTTLVTTTSAHSTTSSQSTSTHSTTSSHSTTSALSTTSTLSTTSIRSTSTQSTTSSHSTTSTLSTTSIRSTSTHSTTSSHSTTSTRLTTSTDSSTTKKSTTITSATYSPTSNPDGTNINVQGGCIVVNDSPRCAGNAGYNVAYQNTYNSSATIYAQFDGSDSTDEYVTPGCEMQAEWPSSYGDVYFGSDNCLLDASSSVIYGQCCTASATTTARNPYYQTPSATTTSTSSASTTTATSYPIVTCHDFSSGPGDNSCSCSNKAVYDGLCEDWCCLGTSTPDSAAYTYDWFCGTNPNYDCPVF